MSTERSGEGVGDGHDLFCILNSLFDIRYFRLRPSPLAITSLLGLHAHAREGWGTRLCESIVTQA